MTVKVNYKGETFDARTRDMLRELDRRTPEISIHLTQGSYSDGSLSAGTHSGGGAVDISVRGMTLAQILTIIKIANEIGFEASWHRTFPEWTKGDHIHMIATGAPDLGEVARNQIEAVRDGFNGLGHLGHGGPDRHTKLRIKGRTWEKYQTTQKAKTRAAVATAAAATALAVATSANAPAPKPAPAPVVKVQKPTVVVPSGSCSIKVTKGKASFRGTCVVTIKRGK